MPSTAGSDAIEGKDEVRMWASSSRTTVSRRLS
jgi:hypothetical protein